MWCGRTGGGSETVMSHDLIMGAGSRVGQGWSGPLAGTIQADTHFSHHPCLPRTLLPPCFYHPCLPFTLDLTIPVSHSVLTLFVLTLPPLFFNVQYVPALTLTLFSFYSHSDYYTPNLTRAFLLSLCSHPAVSFNSLEPSPRPFHFFCFALPHLSSFAFILFATCLYSGLILTPSG